ncbi:type VII secretion protein EccE [Catenulispora rubra]|uniref:type VII secretion protein EccE n=1 Tax=Catenulispora rubra TaxID=280293 RepID=UPI001891F893|nr:type VII secretion protein EccE [Catenulispora rubra]
MSSHAAPAAEIMASAPPIPTAVSPAAVPDPATVPRGAAALDWIAPVRGWQTVAWEAAALAAAAGYGHSTATEATAYAGAGALVGLTSVRFRGRHLAQWADTQGRYRYRRVNTRRKKDGSGSGAAEPLAALLPDLGLGEYVDRAGNRVGLAATDGGWVSAVRLRTTEDPHVGTLIEVLKAAYAGTTIPLASAQLVVWTAAPPEAPLQTQSQQALQAQQGQQGQLGRQSQQSSRHALSPDLSETQSLATMPTLPNLPNLPSPDLSETQSLTAMPSPDLSETMTMQAITSATPPPGQQPAKQSGKQPAQHSGSASASQGSQSSQQQHQPQQLAPMRVTWLALRYRPRQAPTAALARGGGELGSARAVASAALGLVARLDEAGYGADALDQAELGQELMVALHGADPAPPTVLETWRDWSAGALRQICYEPHRALDPAALLGRWTPGAAFTCASYTLSRTARGRVRSEAALRIAGVDAESLRPPFPAIRANGRQQEFVLRTMPLAIHH